MSKRLRVIDACVALIQAALPNATVKALEENDERPSSVGPGGTVVLRTGDPGEPDVDLSPLSYNYVHVLPLEVAGYADGDKTPEQVIDDMLGQIGLAVAADRTLGGLCDFLEARAPTTEALSTSGGRSGRWADAALVAAYATPDPLN